MINLSGSRRLLGVAIAVCLAVALATIGAVKLADAGPGSHPQAGAGSHPPAGPAAWRRVCGQPILRSPFSYSGPAGPYRSGTVGLPTYGTPGSAFPQATAGEVLPAGAHSYASYQLRPRTVYYLVPGVHVGGFEADSG